MKTLGKVFNYSSGIVRKINSVCIVSFCLLINCMVVSTTNGQQNLNKVNDKVSVNVFDNWQFRQIGSSIWNKAVVPGTVHTDLIENKLIPDPFYRTNEKDLQWIDKVDWEYKSVFNVSPEIFSKKNIEICFKGLDTYADVYLNGTKILSANNMFREWNVDCKKLLKESNNELRLYFYSPVFAGLKEMEKFGMQLPASNDQSEGGGMGSNRVSGFIRKAPYHFGWDWGPRLVTSGIWKPIVLNAWNEARICDVQVIQKHNKSEAQLTAKFGIESSEAGKRTISIKVNEIESVNKEIDLAVGLNKINVAFSISKPRLWWPNGMGEAYLYNVEYVLLNGKNTIDKQSVKVGIRTIEITRDKDIAGNGSSFYFKVNGLPVFSKGANYIPNDVFLTRTKLEDYEFIIKSAKDANMNTIRVWGGGIYEYDVFYDLCDKYGIMVWQDFMFACSMYPGNAEFLDNIKVEAVENVKRLRNHPCIALWCGNNEIDVAWQQNNPNGGWGWKQQYTSEQRAVIWTAYDTLFNKLLPSVVGEFDSERFYWPSSPVADVNKHSDLAEHSGDTHYWDVWWGQKPFSEYNNNVGRFMSEYGFQSFPEFASVQKYAKPEDFDIFSEVMKAHQRSSIGNGTILNYMKRDYKVPTDFEKFLYVGQLLQAEGIKTAIEAHRRKMPYCMGSLYWQINDCWPVASWSGIDYYKKWKSVHYFIKKAFAETTVMPYLENDSVKIWVSTVGVNSVKSGLNLKLMDFAGKIFWEKQLSVNVEPNKAAMIYSISVKELSKNLDKTNLVLSTEFAESSSSLSNNLLYLVPAKELNLPKVEIQKSIQKTNDGYVIVLKTNKLTKNVFLSLGQFNGFFSDNYFDLLPGKEVKIDLKSSEDIATIEKELKLMSLVDTY